MRERPVYLAQCYSFRVACIVAGEHVAPGTGRRAEPGGPDRGLLTFRARRTQRTAAAHALRAEVAALLRAERAVLRLHG